MVFSIFTSPLSNFRTFTSLPRETQYPLAAAPAPPPSPWQPLIHFLSPWVCLFLYHINGIIQYVAFGVWLLSLSKHDVFKVHHVALFYSFLWPGNNPLCGYTIFCLFVHPLVDIWTVSTLGLLWLMLLCTSVYKSLCGHTFHTKCFHFSWVYT